MVPNPDLRAEHAHAVLGIGEPVRDGVLPALEAHHGVDLLAERRSGRLKLRERLIGREQVRVLGDQVSLRDLHVDSDPPWAAGSAGSQVCTVTGQSSVRKSGVRASHAFEDGRNSLATADAKGDECVRAPGPAQLVEGFDGEDRAGGADRVSE